MTLSCSTVEVWRQVTSFGLWICAQTAWSRQSLSSDVRWKGMNRTVHKLNPPPPWSPGSPAEAEGRPISVSSRQVWSGRWVLGQPIYIVTPPPPPPLQKKKSCLVLFLWNVLLQNILIFLHLNWKCVCMHKCVCARAPCRQIQVFRKAPTMEHMEIREQVVAVVSPTPPCGSQGLTLGCETWQQSSLFMEPSCWPFNTFWLLALFEP